MRMTKITKISVNKQAQKTVFKTSVVANQVKYITMFLIIIFFLNYLAGHYLLTEMLLEKMVETAAQTGVQGRIINVSSMIHSWVKRDTFRFNEMLTPKR